MFATSFASLALFVGGAVVCEAKDAGPLADARISIRQEIHNKLATLHFDNQRLAERIQRASNVGDVLLSRDQRFEIVIRFEDLFENLDQKAKFLR